jgi:hypothetical protein
MFKERYSFLDLVDRHHGQKELAIGVHLVEPSQDLRRCIPPRR